jgi:hypothetical protein
MAVRTERTLPDQKVEDSYLSALTRSPERWRKIDVSRVEKRKNTSFVVTLSNERARLLI